MHSSLLLAPVPLLCSLAWAGQQPFEFVQANSSTAENTITPNFTSPQIPEDQHHHSEKPDLDLDELFGFFDEPDDINHWTRDPECIEDKTTNEEFCVYANASFANNRGISFFTSPSIASRILDLPAFTQPSLASHINNFTNPPWEIRNIPGRGNGLFATRTLHRGDLILADTPVGVYQSDAFFPDYEIGYKYLRKTFDWLPEETKEVFERMAMHNEGDKVMERINTNAFAGDFEGKPHFLLYPETALMNHDCRPNSMYYHDPKTLIHTTYASRTINPGEEITITYINLLQTRAERHETLQQIWGFTCTCAHCSKASIPTQASEARIAQINQLQLILSDWSQSSQATIQHAEKLLSLYNKESLHAALGTGHMFAALSYNAVGDIEKAKMHAEKAIEAGIVGTSDQEKDVGEMRALIERPKKHWSFGVRNKRGYF